MGALHHQKIDMPFKKRYDIKIHRLGKQGRELSMEQYELSKEQRLFVEQMRQPFAVCQFLDQGVVILAVSDGFCKLFGFQDRAQAYSDTNRNMFKDTHPDDTAKFVNAAMQTVSALTTSGSRTKETGRRTAAPTRHRGRKKRFSRETPLMPHAMII